MPSDQPQTLQEQLVALQEANDSLYRQHANEKAQMQLAIEQEKIRIAEYQAANDAFREENDQWRASYSQLESDKYEIEENLESQKRELEDKVALLEESLKDITSELASDLEELEKEKSTRASTEELVSELQQQISARDERFSQLTTEYDTLHAAYEQLQTSHAAVQIDVERMTADHEEQAKQLKQQVADLQTNVHLLAADDEIKEVNRSALLRQAEEQIQAKDDEILQLQERIKSLEGELDSLSSAGAGKGPGELVRELQQQVFSKSEQLVQQGEKNLALAKTVDHLKAQFQQLQEEAKEVRAVLLRGIAGDQDIDESLYTHVRLTELVRLRIKALEHEWILTGAAPESTSTVKTSRDTEDGGEDVSSSLNPCHLPNVEAFSAIDGLGSIGKLERELRLLRSRNKRLMERTQHLEQELDAAHASMNDYQSMKEKVVDMASRERVEKELRVKSDANCKEYSDKIAVLSEHIEKLMVHLKHEAAAKTKSADSLRRTEKELADTRDKLAVMTKKSTGKEQQIVELEQGARILEDQLRLMDEKFIDVRNKLDWTRANAHKETKKLNNELNALRMKWQIATDAGALSMLPDWATSSMSRISSKSTKKPLGASASESKLGNNPLGSSRGELSPVAATSFPSPVNDPLLLGGKRTRFEIPKLPQPEADNGTPWSDAKLATLQRNLQTKQRL